jgi:hypothetical protein
MLAIASHARAQLCLSATEHSITPKFTEWAEPALSPGDGIQTTGMETAPAPAQLLNAKFVAPATGLMLLSFPAVVEPGRSQLNAPVASTLAHAGPEASNPVQKETLRSLLLASSQTLLADMSPQPAFTE